MTHGQQTVCVLGLGYVGLPTAIVVANAGNRVIGVDVDPVVVESLNAGKAHIEEPDLDALLARALGEGALVAKTQPEAADVFLIAVPTPLTGHHDPDLSFVHSAADSIAPHLAAGGLVLLESTVPPGATQDLANRLMAARPDLVEAESGEFAVDVAHCPERVLPGRILEELIHNDRVVGGLTPEASAAAQRFYAGFVEAECCTTTAATAEMVKLSENAFRDLNIAFANELSMLAELSGVEVWELIDLANRHPRVNILRPGAGVGGHCIAVDPWFMIRTFPGQAPLMLEARRTNRRKTDTVVDSIRHHASSIGARTILMLGLAYKPGVGDMRESPAVEIVQRLNASGHFRVLAADPRVGSLPSHLATEGVELVRAKDGLDEADLSVILVGHPEFAELDLSGSTVMDIAGLRRSSSRAGRGPRDAELDAIDRHMADPHVRAARRQ